MRPRLKEYHRLILLFGLDNIEDCVDKSMLDISNSLDVTIFDLELVENQVSLGHFVICPIFGIQFRVPDAFCRSVGVAPPYQQFVAFHVINIIADLLIK